MTARSAGMLFDSNTSISICIRLTNGSQTAAAAPAQVDDHASADGAAAVVAHNVNRLLHSLFTGDDIFANDGALVRRNREAAPRVRPPPFRQNVAFA